MEQDARIIEQLNHRDQQAIPALEQTYGSLCRTVIRSVVDSPQDTEECLQDVWLTVWNRIPPEHPAMLRPWVLRVARNLALKRYHGNTAAKRDGRYDALLEELAEVLPAGETVEDAVDARELTNLLNLFLSGLDESSRVLFVRRYWFGEPLEALAKVMGLRPNTAAAKLRRLREKLKRFLEKEGYFV